MSLRGILVVGFVVGGCAGLKPGAAPTPSPTPPPAQPPVPVKAPWSAASFARGQVAPAYLTAWDAAENRSTCALLAVDGAATGETARRATFSGGWAVAYDRSGLRSAYGVAGTGSKASDATYVWPDSIAWADGSKATYGLQGGTGPDHLAYLRIPGQACLYNVWSKLGAEHLKLVLGSLRYVETR